MNEIAKQVRRAKNTLSENTKVTPEITVQEREQQVS